MTQKQLHWFAIYTKPRWEKKVAAQLKEMQVEHYCPLNKVVKQWSDRRKTVLEPVFKSYVFVRVPDAEKWDLKKITGIINFVYWLGKPALIKDDDISTIRKFLNEFSDVTVTDASRLEINKKVKVRNGVLMNYHGILVEVSGNRAKVMIESMGIQLSAQFDVKNLEPFEQAVVAREVQESENEGKKDD